MTLREAAAELVRLAADVREVAGRVESPEPTIWALARDLRATAFNLERQAAIARRTGVEVGEPDPSDTSWLRDAAPGEVMEVYGK